MKRNFSGVRETCSQNSEDDSVDSSSKAKKKKKKHKEKIAEIFEYTPVSGELLDTSVTEMEMDSTEEERTDEHTPRKKKKKKKQKEKIAEISECKPDPVESFYVSVTEMDSPECSEGKRTDKHTPRKKNKKKKIKNEDVEFQDFENVDEKSQSDFEEKFDPLLNFDEKSNPMLNSEEKYDINTVPSKQSHPNGLLNHLWPKEKIIQLSSRIKEAIPAEDTLKYTSRLSKLDWNSIAFDEYSGPECEAMWKRVLEKCRCYRLLNDIVFDVQSMLQQPSDSFYQSLKLNKHPEKPSKPLSSFMLFYIDMKDKIHKEHAGLSGPDIARRVGELWKNLNLKKKQKYSDRAQELRKDYEEKLAQFFQNHPEYCEQKKELKKSKKKKSALGFEKPKTAFQLYFQSFRDSYDHGNKHLTDKELYEHCKVEWKSMAESDKVQWIEAAQQEEELYRKNLKKYESEHPGFVPPTVKTIITKNERHVLENCYGKPKKPPSNAYSLYAQQMMQSGVLKDLPSKDRFMEISERWKSLSQSEKEAYAKKLEKLQTEYTEKYDIYLNSLTPEKRKEEEAQNRPVKKKTNSSKNNSSKKIVLEPETPLTNVIELFKLKHVHEWKPNFKMDVNEIAKKKWEKLSTSKKKIYIDELQKLTEEYEKKFMEYIKHCPSEKTIDCLNKIMKHRQKLARHIEEISNQ